MNVSTETLTLHQMRLREKKMTALIEADLGQNGQILLPFAHGTQAGSFQHDGQEYRHISVAEVETLCKQGIQQINIIPLQDVICRLAWLAFESRKRDSAQGANLDAWEHRQRMWRADAMDCLVEFRSDVVHGFVYFRRGEPVAFESGMLSTKGESAQRPEQFGECGPWRADIFEFDPAGKANQCLIMRRAIFNWSRAIFDSYKNIAGEKFLLMMMHELQAQVRPWKWNINIEQHGVEDNHFFPNAEGAAHAYRAILLGTGAQMGFAIGNYLTQRILDEMFNELEKEERAGLETHRLIPASFS